MSQADVDGILVHWGDRLFYPGNRSVRDSPQPRLGGAGLRAKANSLRARIAATVVRRAPQVMVKVTGGGRGMKAIAAHFRYISMNGRRELENEEGERLSGKSALRELADDWRLGGTLIEDVSDRREAFNIMLSMPRGTDPLTVLRAAREFARVELSEHRYVMVLHDHQANPHVHLSVRAESAHGRRLNPRKTDLHRWRETFASKLRGWGIDAEATRQATRGRRQNYEPLWRLKAREEGRLRTRRAQTKFGVGADASRAHAVRAWAELGRVLATSGLPADLDLARQIKEFLVDQFHAPIAPSPRLANGPQAVAEWETFRR